VYDMVVNPQVVADAQADPTGGKKHFLCQLALQCCEQKVRHRRRVNLLAHAHGVW
jgi:hypothetical protein